MKNWRQPLAAAALLLFVVFNTGCWVTAQEGTVQVQTIWDKITRVVRAEDGGVTTWHTFGDDYYSVSIRSATEEVAVTASSKDNAALAININVTYSITPTDEAITAYVRKFGLDEQARAANFKKILTGIVNTETKNAIAEYDAYGMLANQEEIVKKIHSSLASTFNTQLYAELESVQIIGRPDFVDDRIEQAASQVVANQKMKEAEQAGLDAAKVAAERKQVEAKTFADPALLQIRMKELDKEIAAEWSKHQGPLVFGNTPMALPLTQQR